MSLMAVISSVMLIDRLFYTLHQICGLEGFVFGRHIYNSLHLLYILQLCYVYVLLFVKSECFGRQKVLLRPSLKMWKMFNRKDKMLGVVSYLFKTRESAALANQNSISMT